MPTTKSTASPALTRRSFLCSVTATAGAAASGIGSGEVEARAVPGNGQSYEHFRPDDHVALFEESMLDRATGHIVNSNFAEYHVPVNADIREIDARFVDSDDPHLDPLGVRGVGEIGITGMPAAIANAIHQATGKRLRRLPIRLDDLLDA